MPSEAILRTEKACPVVVRRRNGRAEVLAFTHPLAGNQFIKGTIEAGENLREAATRELYEESGLKHSSPMTFIGTCSIGESQQNWHFFKCNAFGLPDAWAHQTKDDFGHVFAFFWHPADVPLDQNWDPVFHQAFQFFAPLCIAD